MYDQDINAKHRAERKLFETICHALGMDAAEAVEKLGRWEADKDNEDRAYARAAGFTMGGYKIVTNMRDFTPKISRDSFVFLAGRFYHVDSMGPKQTVLSQVRRWRTWDSRIFDCTYNDGAGGLFTTSGSERHSTVEFLDDRPVLVPFGRVGECLRAIEGYAWGMKLAGQEYGYMEVIHQLGRLLIVLDIIGVRRFEDGEWRID